ncbi:hypothetical protein D9758_000523 [Tetrapyrgos nigripes]|uniref:Uncharacterized protein n=1 Tax=Tetrapyrgos nigripes TaxID=182062 RepID=A0A8H5H107_9AGAR|nr:hypothetical protein D9758_000523 [Tetrapyrgos nigripes]
MFARLSRSSARTLGLTLPRNTSSSRLIGQSLQDDDEDDDDVVIQLEILMQPLQGFLAPWYHLARSLAPVYQNLQHIFIHDVDRVAQLLLDLEPVSEYDYMYMEYDDDNDHDFTEPSESTLIPNSQPNDLLTVPSPSKRFSNTERELPPRKQRNPSFLTKPIVIPHSSAPTIVITPSPPSDSENCTHSVAEASFASRVPIQDSAFRSKLTVPRHPTFNCIFPPMRMVLSMSMSLKSTSSSPNTPKTSNSKTSIRTSSASSCASIIPPPPSLHPLVKSWSWKDGHWQAVLPGLEEQMRKGVFSRVVPMHVLMHYSSGHGRRTKARRTRSSGSPVLSVR